MKTPLTTISVFAFVGKSKQKTPYTFLKSDFVRIENNELILKSDSRKIKLDLEELKSCLYQMNDLVEIPSAIAPSDEVLAEHNKNYNANLKAEPFLQLAGRMTRNTNDH